MLSLKELRRVARVLDTQYRGHRVERWVQPDAEHICVRLYGRSSEDGEATKHCLLFSCATELARVSRVDRLPKAPERPPAFSSYLRAHLSRAVLRGARIVDDDRQLAVRFGAREGEFELLIQIFGRKSNVYVVGPDGNLVAALRSLDSTRPELETGAPYTSPGGELPSTGKDRFEDADDATLLEVIEAQYAERASEKRESAIGTSLLQAMRRERKSAARRLEKLEVELAEADRAGEYARHGELLKSAMGTIAKGAESVVVRDYETDEEVTIPLDPTKSAKANLEATFKRYQKLLRRLAKAGGKIDDARGWVAQLEEAIEEVTEILAQEESNESRLEEIAADPQIRRLIAKRAAATGRQAPTDEGPKLPGSLRGIPTRLVPRRYLSRDGLEIWVGKSDEGNDYLTTRLARGKDLFFHLDGAPGSHVILRTEGRDDPPSESLLDACELAVRFSKQKNAGSASVHVVPIKQVKKPKGAKKGLVYVTGGKSIHLRREEGRLERVLSSKIE
jgi:predicted ribosome quality control (RQC) complex YloA/Tae2 family protein